MMAISQGASSGGFQKEAGIEAAMSGSSATQITEVSVYNPTMFVRYVLDSMRG
jgi:hypothetical protein